MPTNSFLILKLLCFVFAVTILAIWPPKVNMAQPIEDHIPTMKYDPILDTLRLIKNENKEKEIRNFEALRELVNETRGLKKINKSAVLMPEILYRIDGDLIEGMPETYGNYLIINIDSICRDKCNVDTIEIIKSLPVKAKKKNFWQRVKNVFKNDQER